jgi:voltage-gated potassium channel
MLRELIFAFALVAACLVVHTTAMVMFTEWLFGKRAVIEKRPGLLSQATLLSLIFVVIIVLHLCETGIWALFYLQRGLFADLETSLYFSLVSYTTIGFGDVVLPQNWRLLGGIEGISGVLLCGLSTAFLFAYVNALLHIRVQTKSSD